MVDISAIRYMLDVCRTPKDINTCRRALRRIGITSIEQDKLLKRFAPYYRLVRR